MKFVFFSVVFWMGNNFPHPLFYMGHHGIGTRTQQKMTNENMLCDYRVLVNFFGGGCSCT